MIYIKDFLDVISHEYSNRLSFCKGDIIHSSDVDGNYKMHIGIIMSGAATTEGHTADGRWLINGLIAKSMLFGVELLLETDVAPHRIDYRVRALTDGTAILINRELFLNYLYANPQIFHQILDNVIIKYMFTAKNYRNINQPPFYKAINVLIEIVELLNLHQQSDQIILPSYITQSLLADYCRSSRARITEALEKMRKKGLLSCKKPITIESYQNLQNQVE